MPVWPVVQPDADGIPYVDREKDERPAGEKIPIYHGEVTTPFTGGPVAFSLVVWNSTGGVFSAGEVVDLFLGYREDLAAPLLRSDALGGGSKHPLSDRSPDELSKPVVLLVRSRAGGEHAESLLTLAGLATRPVERLEMRAGGEAREVPLLADPLNETHRLFVAFPPLDPAGEATGTLAALATDGFELWSRGIGALLPPAGERGASYASTHGGE